MPRRIGHAGLNVAGAVLDAGGTRLAVWRQEGSAYLLGTAWPARHADAPPTAAALEEVACGGPLAGADQPGNESLTCGVDGGMAATTRYPRGSMTGSILTTSRGTNTGRFATLDWALFLGVSGIWGASFLFISIGLDAFDPGLITWLRIASGAAVLAFVPRARRPIAIEDRPRVAALSFIWVAIPFTLFPIAQQWIASALAGMLNGAMPIFAAIIASAMLARLPRGAQLLGLAVGFGGVIAISAPSLGEGESQAIGVLLVLAATAFYGLSVNVAAPIQQKYGSMPVMARMLALATVWTTPYGLYGLANSSFAWDSLAAVAAVGILGTGIAFVIMGTLVGRVGPTRASFITYAIPVVALVLGVVFRDETVEAVAIAGVGLVILGALLASLRET